MATLLPSMTIIRFSNNSGCSAKSFSSSLNSSLDDFEFEADSFNVDDVDAVFDGLHPRFKLFLFCFVVTFCTVAIARFIALFLSFCVRLKARFDRFVT